MFAAAPAVDPFAQAAAAAAEAVREALGAANDNGPALGPGLSFETLVTHRDLAAFRASPTQLALIRSADGRGDAVELPRDRMLFHFGQERLPSGRPRLVVLRTGVRAGKSFLAAMALLLSVLTCTFRREPLEHEIADPDGLVGVRKGEFVRALIVAPVMELSKAVLYHLVGTMQSSERLSKLLVKVGSNFCVIRREDGHKVLVKLVAASGGGTNLRSTWLAGVVFDEGAFFDEDGKAVTLKDQLRAAMARLLKGAQAWVPSSPWNDSDPFHELFEKHFGKPGHALAFHSDSRSMNPTLDREEEQAERERDPDNAAREYDAVPLPSSSSLFLPPDALARAINATRPLHLDPLPEVTHYAGCDLGFRKNSSALAISRYEDERVRLAYHEERVPQKGASLKPSEVCRSFAETALGYGARSVKGDLHYADTAHEEFDKVEVNGDGIVYLEWNPSADNQTDAFTEFKRRLAEGVIELPNDPKLINQLKAVTSRPLPGGRVQVQLPKQGRTHGDVAMAVVLSMVQVQIGEPDYDDHRPIKAGRRRW
ncbi:hypothetical protein [Sorangium sp. So ce1024]|uniref:hypothetical protein n=1 Tax=Sorangium sp. So ce1024 TaxID=3133327 RepID=UPI003F07D7F8